MNVLGVLQAFSELRTDVPFPFLSLPAELRDSVYGYCFDDVSIIRGPKGQPRTKHADAILWCSRQLHSEALPIFYKEAIFCLNLAREYAPRPERDFAYMLDHHCKRKEFLAVRAATIQRFHKVQILLDRTGSAEDEEYWQYIFPKFHFALIDLKAGQDVRIYMNLRCTPRSQLATPWTNLPRQPFGMPRRGREGARQRWKERHNMTSEELLARGEGRNFRADIAVANRDAYCFLEVAHHIGSFALVNNGITYVVSAGRHKQSAANDVEGLVDEAGFVDDGGNVWIAATAKVAR